MYEEMDEQEHLNDLNDNSWVLSFMQRFLQLDKLGEDQMLNEYQRVKDIYWDPDKEPKMVWSHS